MNEIITSKYPNQLETKIVDSFISTLKENSVKYSKQEFGRGTKIFVNHNYTKITFHIYNVSDGGKGY